MPVNVADVPVAILAGGLATRMMPLTETVPKSMLLVAGRPFLEHQLDLLRESGVRRVVICAGHLGEKLERYFGDGRSWSMDIEYSYDGPAPLGTGGAIRAALPKLGERFFVLYGDSYLPILLGPVLRAFEGANTSALMTVYENLDRWEASNAELAGDRVKGYDKRRKTSAMRHVDYGLSMFRASTFRHSPRQFDLAELFTSLAFAGQLAGMEVAQRFYEIGSPAGLAELDHFLMEIGEGVLV